jgi:hypothetical protein
MIGVGPETLAVILLAIVVALVLLVFIGLGRWALRRRP